MSIDLTIRSGTTRTFPQQGDSDLHAEVTSWAQDVTSAINASPTSSTSATFDAVVGSAADVTAGLAGYSDIATAIAAVSANDRIFIRENTYTPTSMIDITKALTIIGQGEGAIIAGNNIATGAVIKINASGVTLENIKITQGTGTPTYALEIAASKERNHIAIKADGTFATGLCLNGSVIGATTGTIEYDTNSISLCGESCYTEQLRLEDQTTAGYDLIIKADSDSTVMTADRTLTLDVNNVNRSIDLKGNIVVGDDLTLNEKLTLSAGYDATITVEDAATTITMDNSNLEIESTDASQRTFKVTSAKPGDVTVTLEENLTVSDGKAITMLAEDNDASITYDNVIFEVENTNATQRTVKITSSKAGNTTLSLQEDFTLQDGFDLGITVEDATAAIVLDNSNLEFEFTDAAQHNYKFTSGKAGNITATLHENFTIGDGYDVQITSEDANSNIVLDNANFEAENTNATPRNIKITSDKAGDTTLTFKENFTIGDGADVQITAEDAASNVTLDNVHFEVENTDGTQRTVKITSAKAGNTTVTLQEDLTISDGGNITMVAEDNAASITYDNCNFEVENTNATQRNIKITSDKAGDTTVTLKENFTINDGYDLAATVEDANSTIVLDNANFEVENTNATQRDIKITTSYAGNTTVTVEGGAATISQDYSSDASPTFGGLSLAGALNCTQIATPSTPAASNNKIYPKSDDIWYTLNSSGEERPLGSSSGEYNFLWDKVLADYTTYDDAAAVPDNGTGGAVDYVSVAAAASAISTQAGVLNLDIAKTANNAQGEGVAIDFKTRGSIDNYSCRVCKVWIKSTANYADNDFGVYLRDLDNSVNIYPTDQNIKASTNVTLQQFEFQLTGADDYRLMFHCQSTNANAYTLTCVIGFYETKVMSGAINSDWKACTMTCGLTGATTLAITAYEKRIGDTAYYRGKISWAAVFTGGTNTLTIPSARVIDTAKIQNATAFYCYLGNANFNDQGSSIYYGSVSYNDTTSVRLVCWADDSGDSSGYSGLSTNISTTLPFAWGDTDSIIFDFSVPIVGWSSNQLLSSDTNNILYACNAHRITSAQTITKDGWREVVFNSSDVDSAGIYSSSTGRATVTESGKYVVAYMLNAVMGGTAAAAFYSRIYVNGATQDKGSAFTDDLANSKSYNFPGYAIFDLVRGDYISIYCYATSQDVTIAALFSNFSIHKISSPQQIAASEKIVAIYQISAATANNSIAASSTEILDFDTKIKDSHNLISTGAAFKFTSNSTRDFNVNVSADIQSLANDKTVTLKLYKNGALYSVIDTDVTSNGEAGLGGGTVVSLVKNDYIDARITNGDAVNAGVVATTASSYTISITSIN